MESIDFKELFKTFSSVKIGVIGDMMLDCYLWGKVERISPEAPVPVVTVDHREYRIGGAGNVALNLASLGAPVSVFLIGQDDDGRSDGLLNEQKINTAYLLNSTDRITTNKMGHQPQSAMMRLDSETVLPLSTTETN